ncbi:MAG: serine hydroxymethyltransferase [Patescibacteria group bacterium]
MKDTQIKKLIEAEKKRQKKVINLIASENYVSKDVLEALGTELTNKYAEGYPNARYYGGNEVIDQVELLCQKRALELFKLDPKKWAVNVQPLSGSPANLAVFTALVPIGEKIMGMKLSSGGHLTHAQPVSLTGKAWKQVPYEVSKATGMLDYAELKKIASAEKPKVFISGFTAYPRLIDWKACKAVATAGESIHMVDMSHIGGLVAGGVYPSPFEFADVVTTTTHKTLRGPRSALIFSRIDERGLDKKINKAIIPGLQGGPHMNQIAAVAVALKEAKDAKFKSYVKQVIKNAKALAKELKKLGWGVVTGDTDSHMVLLDTWLDGKGVSGNDASVALEKVGIIVNKNAIPHDARGVLDPSGIRLGTAAETTRGKKEKDFVVIAKKIDATLRKLIK